LVYERVRPRRNITIVTLQGRRKIGLLAPAILRQRLVEVFDKSWSVKRLDQEADRPRVQRPLADALFGERRDENDRQRSPLGSQQALQLKAAHARHLNICDQARRVIQLRRLQELAGRRKRISDVSKRSHEPVGRSADGRIIIDDRDHRYSGQISPSFIYCRRRTKRVALRHNAPRRSKGKSYLGFDGLRLGPPNPQHFGHSDQIGQRFCTHFSHDVPPVNLDGNLG
jgi:hypothetical protein